MKGKLVKIIIIKKIWAKTRHSKPEGSKKGANHRKKRSRKDKAQGTKGRFQQKAARNTKRGGNIYVKYI